MSDNIYATPDIRKQTFEEAEAFIQAKRVKRMVMLTTFQQKQAAKIATLKDAELTRFTKRAAKVKKSLDAVADAIDRAERDLALLLSSGNTLNNLDASEKEL